MLDVSTKIKVCYGEHDQEFSSFQGNGAFTCAGKGGGVQGAVWCWLPPSSAFSLTHAWRVVHTLGEVCSKETDWLCAVDFNGAVFNEGTTYFTLILGSCTNMQIWAWISTLGQSKVFYCIFLGCNLLLSDLPRLTKSVVHLCFQGNFLSHTP